MVALKLCKKEKKEKKGNSLNILPSALLADRKSINVGALTPL